MELRRYLTIVRRRAILIIAIVVAGVAAGWFVTSRTNHYTASATLYVGSRAINVNPTSGQVSNDRALGLDRLITTFTFMLKSEPVTKDGIANAGVSRSNATVIGNTTAQQIPNTNLIQVSVTDTNPAAARSLANGLADALVRQIQQFEPQSSQANQVISVYHHAAAPTSPNSIGLARNLGLGALLGLVVGGILIALLEYLDISLRSSDDVERLLELPVLGVIPAMGDQLPAMERVRPSASGARVG